MFRSLLRTRSWIGRPYIVGVSDSVTSRCPRTKAEPAITIAGSSRFIRSYHHRACGYLAGLHSYQPRPGEEAHETASESESEPQTQAQAQADFDSFESAWDAIQLVPDELLNDFEDELWETQSKRFVYGTKQVSVIDAVENHADATSADNDESEITKTTTAVFRYLILNERPNLIQTAVEVPCVGAPYHHYFNIEEDEVPETLIPRPPSPVSQTHLGGLAMALPFWYSANGDSDNPITTPEDRHHSPPNCLLIGAGGASLAHTLAANLFLKSYNSNRHQNSVSCDSDAATTIKSINRPELTAVEACPEILRASQLWFGAGDEKEEATEAEKSNHPTTNTEPPFFDLVCDTGESYLESLVASLKREEKLSHETNSSSSSSSHRPIDILIIDAEDGSAPPISMRTPAFWNEMVLPSLNPASGSVVAVNAIGTDSETSALVCTMREAFCDSAPSDGEAHSGYDYTVLVVDPPPEAKVTGRHKLIFALPSKLAAESDAQNWGLTEDDLKGCVDAPKAWEEQIKAALRVTLAEP